MRVPTSAHVPERYAADTGREFDPSTEIHHFGFVVKTVDPGCTLEFQIEERSGRISRITTTENPLIDRRDILVAIMEAAGRMLDEWRIG